MLGAAARGNAPAVECRQLFCTKMELSRTNAVRGSGRSRCHNGLRWNICDGSVNTGSRIFCRRLGVSGRSRAQGVSRSWSRSRHGYRSFGTSLFSTTSPGSRRTLTRRLKGGGGLALGRTVYLNGCSCASATSRHGSSRCASTSAARSGIVTHDQRQNVKAKEKGMMKCRRVIPLGK